MAVLSLISILSCVEKKEPQKVFKLESIKTPTERNASLPYLFAGKNTTLLSWVEKVDDSMSRMRYSELKDGVWQKPNDIQNGTDWFVNWADFPSIVENNGNLFSHVLKKSSEGTYSYDVKMSLKAAGNSVWNTDAALHTDGTPTEHGFVSAVPFQEDSFFVTWLDGRNTEEKEGNERGAMTLRAAEVSVSGEIKNEAQLDSRTCDCCQTTAAMTENGPVVVYRDRTANEIRDISIVRQVNGKWTDPVSVNNDNWQIKGCPVNGPKAVAYENVLAVAWFTAANAQAAVKIAFSENNGANFNESITIASDNVIGRVDVVLLNKNTALVSYVKVIEGKAQIMVTKVESSGKVSKNIPITEVKSSRKSGFPQLELVGDRLFFAWTDVTKESETVRTASIDIQAF